MKKWPETKLFCFFLGVLAIELVAHRLLAAEKLPQLTRYYLSESKTNSITTLVDNFLPGIAVGLATGWTGWRWSMPRFILSVALLDVAIVCSEFLYRLFFDQSLLWWWPPTAGDMIFRLSTTFVLLVLFASGVRKNKNKKPG